MPGVNCNVDYVLSSHYQVVDSRIRVTSQLLNVTTGNTEQTLKSETELASLFDVQDTIANEIGNAILTKFGASTSIFAARRGTENEEAYSLYQQAWYLIDKGTAEESAKAAKLLDRAVELDPNYSQAWAVRSHAYCQFAHLGGSEPLSVFATAEPMLERSMSLDPNNAMGHTIRGTINRDFHWNLPQAINDLQQAIKLDPSIVLAHRVLAGAYYRNGQFAEAVESEKRAIDLHPTSLVDHWFLGNYLVAAGRKAEGLAQLNRVAEMNPKYPSVYMSLWEIYHLDGDHAKAYENFIKMKEAYGSPSEDIATFKRAYDTGGWSNVIRAELDWVLSKEPKGKYCNYKYYIAALAALSGDKELAFSYLDKAISYRLIAVSFMKVDPKFISLRSDPRFPAIAERIGLSRRS
jgi:tetratricopeptide (TPR) repeat protein